MVLSICRKLIVTITQLRTEIHRILLNYLVFYSLQQIIDFPTAALDVLDLVLVNPKTQEN